MEIHADVIIVGAGPAGTIAAYHLASQGISVLILEKSTFPRYKVCGGGLTHKILHEIPFDISSVFEAEIRSIQFSCNLKEVFTRSSDVPLMYSTMRDKLDDLLLRKAQQAGASVIFGEKVISVVQTTSTASVMTKTQTYHSRLLIGSEGATGIVARSAGLRDNILKGLAWEAEMEPAPEALSRYSSAIFLDWGTFPGGYGWVFPKKDHFSIGVGGPASLVKGMMPYYHRFLEYFEDAVSLPDRGLRGTYPASIKSWPIPVRVKKSLFHHGRILVAGDSAGLTDALTGEGIYYAVRSGKLAADACSGFLNAKQSSLQSYSEQVNDELMDELLEANKIKYLFNTVPLKIHHFVRDSDRAWTAFGKVLRGQRKYADVRMGFGKWKFLWGAACLLSKWISGWKEKKYQENG